ncbi:prepilin-type N-terminal cleavage/methylation domain-containing protein [bacterium]|jgi:prepilin-type N-terminal cleavage/methylation domain-containing protein|nr:prepilin-type N-terminal cleavage/methylation domain-containing protein [bacterium]
MKPTTTPPSAFTLLEVILALAIFVGSIAVLSRLLIVGGEFSETAEFEAQAWLLAESRWAEIESGIRTLSQPGPFPIDEAPGWEWGFEATAGSLPSLYTVKLFVRKAGQLPGDAASIELTRLYFDDSSARSASSGAGGS